jgi:hypothetical protein
MSPLDPQPSLFAVLTLIAAPAILTNASSVLALNTANRFGRVVDRSREVKRALAEALGRGVDRDELLAQLERLNLRGMLLLRAQTGLYVALGGFVSAALVSVLGASLAARHPDAHRAIAACGFALGLAGTVSLIYACVLIVRETRLALAGLRAERDLLIARYDQNT